VNFCAGYGPEPFVSTPGLVGASGPIANLGGVGYKIPSSAALLETIPPAIVSSPVGGKLPGLGTN
jgi:hypothetical protein